MNSRSVPSRAILATAALTLFAAEGLVAQAGGSEDDEVFRSGRHDFRTVMVVDGLEHPWSMAWLPGGDMLVTERPGRLRVVRDGTLAPDPVEGVPEVRAQGQGGLLDVVLHPEFETNRLVYLSFSKPNEDASEATTAVVRGQFEGDRLMDVEEIFVAEAWAEGNVHFAGRMVFDRDGYLFLSVGDRGADPDLLDDQPAQSLENHQGTILRLHDDGSVPDDNPFVDRDAALPEIWSYGHRNPQGLVVHPETGEIWSNEHGPRGGDEVNIVREGRNYGWPVATYGINYQGTIITEETSREEMEPPAYVWVPSIATSGMMIYDGERFPWWRGSVFVGGLAGQRLSRLTFEGHRSVSEEPLLEEELGRVRDVRQGPDGYIYLAIDDRSGQQPTPIVRLEPVESNIELPTTAR